MTHPRKLAPHDAELVEADAEALYLTSAPPSYEPIPWAETPEYVRQVFRAMVADPYSVPQLPSRKDLPR